jgi:hypothetical protein
MDVLLVVVSAVALFWLWARHETVKSRAKKGEITIWSGANTRPKGNSRSLPKSFQPLSSIGILIGTSLFLTTAQPYGQQFSLEGTGRGQIDDDNLANFPPPEIYQQIGGSSSVVMFRNNSPDALNITLKSAAGERIELKLPACEECAKYDETNAPECHTVGPPMRYELPPGSYQAKAIFWGKERTAGFKSQWVLSPGYEYWQCVYTSDEMRMY